MIFSRTDGEIGLGDVCLVRDDWTIALHRHENVKFDHPTEAMVCASVLGPQEFIPCVLFFCQGFKRDSTLMMSRDILDGGAAFQKGKGHLFDHLPLVSRFRNFEARDTIRVTATLQVTTFR